MKRGRLFEPLTPPPGGLEALRARLDAASPARRARALTPLLVAAALAAIALVVVTRRRSVDFVAAGRQIGDASEVALGLTPLQGSAAVVDPDAKSTTALTEVRTSNPEVAFYWVSSTDWKD